MNEAFNHCIDRSLSSFSKHNEKDFAPDLLITIGGAVVSKKIKSFLRSGLIQQHWKLGCEFTGMDTYQVLTHTMPCEPSTFIKKLNEIKISPSHLKYNDLWKSLDRKNISRIKSFDIKNEKLTDILIFKTIYIDLFRHFRLKINYLIFHFTIIIKYFYLPFSLNV